MHDDYVKAVADYEQTETQLIKAVENMSPEELIEMTSVVFMLADGLMANGFSMPSAILSFGWARLNISALERKDDN